MKPRYKIIKQTRLNHEYGNVYTTFRVKKRILGLYWDIGGAADIEGANRLIEKDRNPVVLPKDELISVIY